MPAVAKSNGPSFESPGGQQSYDFNDSGKYLIRCGEGLSLAICS